MTSSDPLPENAVALISGASSGIGLATAQKLLARGLRVIAVARGEARLRDAFAGAGERVLVWPLDVTDGPAVAALPDSLPQGWRDIEVLVANAGSDRGGRRPFLAGEMADWAQTVETNVTGVMALCHALLPGMTARGRGHVVVIGSIAGLAPSSGMAVYAASKFAVRAFTDSLRKELKHAPLRVTEVLPGLVRTGFAEARYGGDSARAAEYYDSFAAALEPDDIAAAVLFALTQPPQVNIGQIVVTPTGDK